MPIFILLVFAFLAGCSIAPPAPVILPPQKAPAPQPVSWESIPNWPGEDLAASWNSFLQSCQALKKQPPWTKPCTDAGSVDYSDQNALKSFFEQHFTPYQILNPEGSDEGLITGYYQPILKGSRTKSARYRYPIYSTPKDLLIIDLAKVYPELKNMRLRGRLQGNRVVPYYNRSEISQSPSPLAGNEIFWVENPVELFFLQIQGSGKILFDDGQMQSIGYDEQNGYPYQSIGKVLVERGEMTLDHASMAGIRQWAEKNPKKLDELLAQNPSYVFFRNLPDDLPGPLGALGVPLSAGRSIAVDPRSIPLGAPVFLSTTWPESGKPLNRLMLAQDTGGAIRGAVRADFFWGLGADAGEQAGKMKQRGKMWMLLPLETGKK